MCRVLLLYVLWLVCSRLNAQWVVLQLPATENLRSVAFFVVASAPPPHQLYRAQVLFDQTNHRTYARVKVSFGATLAAFNARRLF
jgi:hypothetical protein